MATRYNLKELAKLVVKVNRMIKFCFPGTIGFRYELLRRNEGDNKERRATMREGGRERKERGQTSYFDA
jgi:hypothetical protein